MSANDLLVFVGSSTLDTITLVKDYPSADSRTIAQDFKVAGGGPAATAAVAAARLGANVAFAGLVGADETGDQVIHMLEGEGIDVGAVERVRGQATGASVIVVAEAAGTRAIITRPVPAFPAKPWPALRALLKRASWVHVDHLGWNIIAGGEAPMLSVDAGNPIPGFTPVGVDLYVPTIERLRLESQADLPDESLVRAALEAGAANVVATAGAHGAWIAGASTPLEHIPATKVVVLSTLGAGDVFHGALLAAISAGQDLRTAAETASFVAGQSCSGLDGRSAIPRTNLFRP